VRDRAATQSSMHPETVDPTYPALETTIWRQIDGAMRPIVMPASSGLTWMLSTEPPVSSVAAAWPLSCMSTTNRRKGHRGQAVQKTSPATKLTASAIRSGVSR